MDSLISIIMPVYNGESSLKVSLDSILNQTYKNLEIILINDGSTDRSLEICEYYARKDNRIIIVNQKNKGAGAARNTGLDIATGDYVGFLDCDDYIMYNMYEIMLRKAIKDLSDIVHCGCKTIIPNGTVVHESNFEEKNIHGNRGCVEELCRQKNMNYYGFCKLIKRKIIGSIRYEDYYNSEDAVFLLKIFMNCQKVSIINDLFCVQILSPNSLSRSSFNIKRLDAIKAGKDMYEIVNKVYPEFSIYYLKYIMLYSVYCYSGIYYSDYSDKNVLLKSIYDDFKKYYNIQESNKKKIHFPHSLIFRVFNSFPKLYTVINHSRKRI